MHTHTDDSNKKRRYRRKNVRTCPNQNKIPGNIMNNSKAVTSLSRKSMKTIFTWLDFLDTSPETLSEFLREQKMLSF